MKTTRGTLGAFLLSTILTFGSVSAVLAAWTGQLNAVDRDDNGWIGADNPDGVTGKYAPNNIRQDYLLQEWDEPNHDMLRNMWNLWDNVKEQKLNNEQADKAMTFEFRIHEHDFYNWTGVMNTTLPFTGVDPDNFIEELNCKPTTCTEVDVEIQDASRIDANRDYWAEIQIDSEKNPTPQRPDFVAEVEYCNNFFIECNFDATSWMRKKLVVR